MKKVIFSVLFLFVTSAHAYGPAGCGVGAIIFEGKTEWWAQVLAATTNGTLGNQTFGITSGTLECDATPLIDLGHVETFIESNENSVANELAKGNGDSITVLTYAFSCENSSDFASAIKKNYSSIYSGLDDNPKNIAARINSVAKSVPNCSAI